MLTVNLDGQNFQFDSGAKNINEIIELAKNDIEQDKFISDIKLSGRDLAAVEYKLPLLAHKDVVLEISTQTKNEFINDKINIAGLSLDVVIAKFNIVPPSFEEQGILEASQHLAGAVKDFQFFLGWFPEILKIDEQKFASLKSDFDSLVQELSPALREVLLSQSVGDWKAINDTIDGKILLLLLGLSESIRRVNA